MNSHSLIQQTPIFCSSHTSQIIQWIDADSSPKKEIYCVECVLESELSSSVPHNLMKISDFLERINNSFTQTRLHLEPLSEPLKAYLDLLSERDEQLWKFKTHISQEKNKIDEFFDELLETVIEKCNKIRANYLKTLDERIQDAWNNYKYFEEQLKAYFPSEAALDLILPSERELQEKMNQIEDGLHFEQFFKDLKTKLNKNKESITMISQNEKNKKLYLNRLEQDIKTITTTRPKFEVVNQPYDKVVEEVTMHLDVILRSSFVVVDLLRPIVADFQSTHLEYFSTLGSTIVKPEDFLTVKKWLPDEYAFIPHLLYKGSVNGMTPKAFHEGCDMKGPTLTILKCKFMDSPQVSVIGGFLDTDWHQNGIISSEGAFVFSLTLQVKCNIIKPECAAIGDKNYGPSFGYVNSLLGTSMPGDIDIQKNLKDCKSYPHAYAKSYKIFSSVSGLKSFTLLDVEVYSLDQK